MELLRSSLELREGEEVIFMSDMQKVLDSQVILNFYYYFSSITNHTILINCLDIK